MTEIAEIQQAVASYCRRNSLKSWRPLAALIDMDGVLYDSMPRHAQAWHKMMSEIGIQTDPDEFYLYEGSNHIRAQQTTKADSARQNGYDF